MVDFKVKLSTCSMATIKLSAFTVTRMDSQTGSGPQDEGSNGSEGISGSG